MEVEHHHLHHRSDGDASVAAQVVSSNPCLFERKESDDDSEDFECPAAKRARVEDVPAAPVPAPALPLQPPPPSLTPPASVAPGGDDDDGGGLPRANATRIVADKYLILDPVEGSSLFRCINILTNQEFVCKMASGREAGALVSAHARLSDASALVSPLREALPCAGVGMCLVLARAAGPDLHTHVRARRRLRDGEARRLFRQAAAAVAACHERGVVLRDLKLRKFVFADEQRTQLRLESLEDAVVLEAGDDDRLRDKRGCPAYVSPEILRCPPHGYSGRAADMWSLGVILYTMLVGRYPFNEAQHHALFAKISRGAFALPEQLSAGARCLIRSLLRRDPAQRLTAADVLLHPWLQAPNTPAPSSSTQSPSAGEREAPSSVLVSVSAPILVPQTPSARDTGDQVVPDFCP